MPEGRFLGVSILTVDFCSELQLYILYQKCSYQLKVLVLEGSDYKLFFTKILFISLLF